MNNSSQTTDNLEGMTNFSQNKNYNLPNFTYKVNNLNSLTPTK